MFAVQSNGGLAQLLALGREHERLRIGRTDIGLPSDPYTWPSVYAHDKHALVTSMNQVVSVVVDEAWNPSVERTTVLPDFVNGVDLNASRALLSLGWAGAAWVEM